MMRQVEKYRNIAANYDHMALTTMIKSFGGYIWILPGNGAEWPSKPKL
jgi:hypothetical protein